MTSEQKLAELTDFENVLDTFGGNPARWPEARRERLLRLVASDRQAERLLREAEALDAVLTRAAGPPVGNTAALSDRIVAAAIANAQPARSPAERIDAAIPTAAAAEGKAGVVIAWPKSGSKHRSIPDPVPAPNQAARATMSAGPVPRRDRTTLRAAALLAASLLVGVFVGAMDFVPSDVSRLVPGVEASTETNQSFAFLQADDLLDFLEEGPL